MEEAPLESQDKSESSVRRSVDYFTYVQLLLKPVCMSSRSLGDVVAGWPAG